VVTPPNLLKLFGGVTKLNEINVTEGRQGYLVKKTFIPDDKLEKNFKMIKITR
jgi:hypothetical protein